MVWFRRRKEEESSDGTMTLMEHLYELRRRLAWAAAFIVLGSVLGFLWFDTSVPGIGSLNHLLIDPYCTAKARIGDETCSLLATTPFAGLAFQLKAALLAGVVFSSPGWLYHVWSFVTPALYSRERKYAITFVSLAATLFIAGAFLAYLVIGEGLRVLMGFGGENLTFELNPENYYSFLMTLLVVFGVSFELPLFLVGLNFVGAIRGKQLAKWRRYAIFVMFVFAALVVPGNDPITMCALAVAMCLLYEVSVQVAKFNDRRRGRNSEDYSELADDEASSL
jgi:sec-independent protein translocase protein TatC